MAVSQTAICRSPEVPYRRFSSTTLDVPVLAKHYDGMLSVKAEVTDGTTTVSDTVTSSEGRRWYDGYEKPVHLWLPTVSGIDTLDDGTVTVTITATPNDVGGGNTAKVITYDMVNNVGGTVPQIAYYVDPIDGNNNDNGLTPATAFKTLAKAVQMMESGTHGSGPYNGENYANGGIIYLMEGTHIAPGQPFPYPDTRDEWLTIRPAANHNRNKIILPGSTNPAEADLRSISKLLVLGLDLVALDSDHKDTNQEGKENWDFGSSGTNGAIWLDDCKLRAPIETDPETNYDDYLGYLGSDFSAVYLTRNDIRRVQVAAKSTQLARDNVGQDLCRTGQLVFRCSVNNVYHNMRIRDPIAHPDGKQLFGAGNDNIYSWGDRLYDIEDAQCLYHDQTGSGTPTYSNIAYESCVFGYGSPEDAFVSQFFRGNTHVLMANCTFSDQPFHLSSNGGATTFDGTACKIANTAFDSAVHFSGWDEDGVALTSNHYKTAPSQSFWSGTTGDPKYTDAANWDFRPIDSTSPLWKAGSGSDAMLDNLPTGPNGAGPDSSAPHIGAYGMHASGVVSDEMGLTVTFPDGTEVQVADMTQVFDDATGTLYEYTYFGSETPGTVHTDANWDTYYVIKFGVDAKASGDWDVYLWPIYGSPNDPNEKPYYSRLDLTVTVNGSTVALDDVGSAEVIGHGQGIPCTYVAFDPDTETVSSSVEGHTLAFTQTRIRQNPNATGFNGGEFVLRYDHATEAEGREEFYVAACWPGHFVDTDGTFLRPDVPPTGEKFGFTYNAGRGPYIHEDDKGKAKNYPITHIANPADSDKDKWSNTWKKFADGQRLDSGIGPFCLNIVSRGAAYLRDFGMAWLVKSLSCRVMGQFHSPTAPKTRATFTYTYDNDAMRAKGRIIWTMTLLYRALNLMASVRDTDAEMTTLTNDLVTRGLGILTLLKTDYDNGSWLETRNGDKGRAYAYWELGHYWQGLLIFQEAHLTYLGSLDAKVDAMMRTFADKIYDNTFLWTNGGAHPRNANTTYSGGVNGYYIEYLHEIDDEDASTPTTGIAPTLVAVYEWSKAVGLNTGATLDAILAQSDYANQSYVWKYGNQPGGQKLFGSAYATLTFATETGTPVINYNGTANTTLTFKATAQGRLSSGSLPVVRKGTAIALNTPLVTTGDTSSGFISKGTAIAYGTGLEIMAGNEFSYIRGDDFIQPFTPSLDQSRTLDGTEAWTFSVRETKTGSVLLTLTKAGGGIQIDGSNNPEVIFTPTTLDTTNFPPGADKTYIYDLEMVKDGKRETGVIDNFTVIGDISR